MYQNVLYIMKGFLSRLPHLNTCAKTTKHTKRKKDKNKSYYVDLKILDMAFLSQRYQSPVTGLIIITLFIMICFVIN